MNPIQTDPEIMGGTPCFAGTRVPVTNLFDYLSRGDPLDEFLQQFPSVMKEQAVAVLELASRMVSGRAGRSAAEWEAEFNAWITSHEPVTHVVDDSRESIYEGRGE